jgi:hypothetical protein
MLNDAIAWGALAESVAPYLRPGEEIVAVDDSSAVDFWKGKRAISDRPMSDGVRFLRRQMGVVITTQRFLAFRVGGLPVDRAQELLTDVPVGDVDAIVCKSYWYKAFEVHLTLRGVEYPFIVPHIGRAQRMAKALEIVQRGTSGA